MKKHIQNHKDNNAGILIIQKNKKAYFEYEILDKYECGIMLLGAEVKSIREHKVQFTDSFAKVYERKVLLHNMHISPYKFHTHESIDPIRIRVLLLHKEEIKKLKRQIEEKGRTLIPLAIYLKKGLVKIELGLGLGKNIHDKKEDLKAKTAKREAEKEIKSYFKQ